MIIAWLIKAVFGVFDSKYMTKEEKMREFKLPY